LRRSGGSKREAAFVEQFVAGQLLHQQDRVDHAGDRVHLDFRHRGNQCARQRPRFHRGRRSQYYVLPVPALDECLQQRQERLDQLAGATVVADGELTGVDRPGGIEHAPRQHTAAGQFVLIHHDGHGRTVQHGIQHRLAKRRREPDEQGQWSLPMGGHARSI
jgi:hypothetical protein